MDNHSVFDNFLPESFYQEICDAIPNLPYNYISESLGNYQDNRKKYDKFGDFYESPLLYHILYDFHSNQETPEYSNFYINFKPLLNFIEINCNFSIQNLVRMKVNLSLRDKHTSEGKLSHYPHTDYNHSKMDNMFSCVYYPFDGDGDTVLFDNNLKVIEKIQPKQNRLLMFPCHVLHASNIPSNCSERVIVNINVLGQKNEF